MNPETLSQIFGENGILPSKLSGYESRPGQRQMAEAVAEALDREGLLAVEAETGIGKTLAYLIPAVLSRQKIIISTNTLNLQEQILRHEIPFILEHIDPGLTALCVKGRQNYLCLHRWHKALATPQLEIFPDRNAGPLLQDWLQSTLTGDRAELAWLPDNSPLWHSISATASQCLGSSCPDNSACFVNQLRKKAAASRLLIVNHHLFFSDLGLRRLGYGEVLPRAESVIFDEAHHLEAVATNYFGRSFSTYQLLDLTHDIRMALIDQSAAKSAAMQQLTAPLITQTEHFAAIFPPEKGRYPLLDFADRAASRWETELQALFDNLDRLEQRLQDLSATEEFWSPIQRRCSELRGNLQAITAGLVKEDPLADPYIRWFERRDRSIALTASPVEIADELHEHLYSRMRSCIFTSATLTADGKFAYFYQRLGLPEETPSLSLPSPFDYERRTLLYIPDNRGPQRPPEPGAPAFAEWLPQQILAILEASRGRALVLFTSLRAMHDTRTFLADRLEYPVLVQGEAPRDALLAAFSKQTDSVLLAVASFWEGVNVPGEALSCVIIDKLPFEVPSDPVIMARIDRIRQEGGNPFFDFQIPRAILALRQGIGRLMRAAGDRGVLAVLDVRLYTKKYGKKFLNSLPPSPLTRDLEKVRTFLADD